LSPLLHKRRRVLVAPVIAAVLVILPASACAQAKRSDGVGPAELASIEQVSKAFRQVAKGAQPGVVQIRVSGGQPDPDTLQRAKQQLRERGLSDKDADRLLRQYGSVPGTGSGIVFAKTGYILTNNHVVNNRSEITVRVSDDREFTATVVGTDPKSDLALIKVDATDLHPLPFGDSDQMEVGDWVLAVGAPFGLTQTVTHGIISAKDRRAVPDVQIAYQDFLQTDAAINPGNSGGPLLNLRGEVIGVNTAIATNGEAVNAGVAFTIPSNMARKIAKELMEHGEVARGWMGVEMAELTEDDVATLALKDRKGALVNVIFGDSPAASAGLLCEDVILAGGDRPVADLAAVRSAIADIKPGEETTLRVLRDAQERTVKLKLGKQPAVFPRARQGDNVIVDRPIEPLALHVRSLRENLAVALARSDEGSQIAGLLNNYMNENHTLEAHGAVVVRSKANTDDLKPGDLVVACNGKRVESASDLVQALRAEAQRNPVKLQVLNTRGQRRVVYVERH
jgi:serine protease Do